VHLPCCQLRNVLQSPEASDFTSRDTTHKRRSFGNLLRGFQIKLSSHCRADTDSLTRNKREVLANSSSFGVVEKGSMHEEAGVLSGSLAGKIFHIGHVHLEGCPSTKYYTGVQGDRWCESSGEGGWRGKRLPGAKHNLRIYTTGSTQAYMLIYIYI
jgi:hypothetical protein